MRKSKAFLAVVAAFLAAGAFAAHEGAPPLYPNFGLPRVEEMMFLVLQIPQAVVIRSALRLPSRSVPKEANRRVISVNVFMTKT